MQERIYDAIIEARRPLNRAELMDKVYCSGGYYSKERPESRNILAVQIALMNRATLHAYGIEIKGSGGPGSTYTIREYNG